MFASDRYYLSISNMVVKSVKDNAVIFKGKPSNDQIVFETYI